MNKDIEEIVDEDMELGIYDEVDFVPVYEIDNIGRKVSREFGGISEVELKEQIEKKVQIIKEDMELI